MSRKNLPTQDLNTNVAQLHSIDFKSGKTFTGNGFIPFADLPRVCAEIVSVAPEFKILEQGVKWQLISWVDVLASGAEEYRIKIDLHVQLPLECQRCLQAYEHGMQVCSQFVLLDSAEEVDNFPLDIDHEDALLNSYQFNLIEVIEDEILLNLPLIPMHDLSQCHAAPIVMPKVDSLSGDIFSPTESENTPNHPFSGLKNLKFDA
jgi:uncharacterized protein